MPAGFERCVREGGKVRTKTLSKGRYQYICIKDNEVYPGEIHKKKGEGLKKALKGK